MEIIDISMEIGEDMVTYPGDPKPSIERYMSIPEEPYNLTKLTLGTHTGTHVDTKRHIRNEGTGVLELPLDALYGPCKVLDVSEVDSLICAKDLMKFDIDKGDIILLKTKNSEKGYKKFYEEYVSLGPSAAKYLVEKGVRTLGIDYLSVESFDSTGEVHRVLLDTITVFEGLVLKDVKAGEYLFCGLPLKINADGAPARAILIKE